MTTIPNWITPAGFLFTATENVYTATSLVASGTGTLYSVISGGLPPGLVLSSTGTISGSPLPVLNVTNNKFVIRAVNSGTVADRTFNIDIIGPSAPVWNSASGYLPVGVFGEDYAQNNQYVSYQLVATPNLSPAGTELHYYIADGDGKLPPGLTLSTSGKLSGFVRDKLTFDGNIAATGGYDDEAYDGYTYDHATSFIGTATDVAVTGLPKLYQFYVTATDGVVSSKQLFKIIVTNVNIIKYNSTSMPVDIVLSNTGTSIQPLQWLNGSDLGVIRANNNHDISVTAYDPDPTTGPVTYSAITSTNVFLSIPEGLTLDSASGNLYGFVPYQPAYTKNYSFGIQAVKVNSSTLERFTTTNTFSLAVKGEVESTIKWVSTGSLGTIETGIVSELAVVAKEIKSSYSINYTLTAGSLPPGLTLERDGSLSGAVNYGAVGTYTFTVLASDVYQLSSISANFSLTVIENSSKQYTSIYTKPFLSVDKRNAYNAFVTNSFTFDPSLIYRYYDPNFGIQHDIKVVLEYGIEKTYLDNYFTAMQENFYRKRFWFGDVKLAVATDITGAVIYEVVYVNIVEDVAGANPVEYSPDNTRVFYPASIANMRSSLEKSLLPDGSYVSTNEYNLPRFMRSVQAGDYKPEYYIPVMPICYALPGQGNKIINRIRLSGFDFKQFDFEIDRITVQQSLDYTTAKYLIFERQSIGELIAQDNILFGPDGLQWSFDDQVPITKENNQ